MRSPITFRFRQSLVVQLVLKKKFHFLIPHGQPNRQPAKYEKLVERPEDRSKLPSQQLKVRNSGRGCWANVAGTAVSFWEKKKQEERSPGKSKRQNVSNYCRGQNGKGCWTDWFHVLMIVFFFTSLLYLLGLRVCKAAALCWKWKEYIFRAFCYLSFRHNHF